MSLLAAYIVPHPPLAVPAVGRGQERRIQSTLDGYRDVAHRIAAIGPDLIVIVSPHTAYFADWVLVAGGKGSRGSLARFGAPQVCASVRFDDAFRSELESLAQEAGIPAGRVEADARELDHGMLVPLSFLEEAYPSRAYEVVSVGGSALPPEQLLAFGRCIAEAAVQLERRCVLLVSGDLSHKLAEDGPYGFDPAGPLFDAAFQRIVNGGDLREFATLDPALCEQAAECGLSGFVMMAGALERAEELAGRAFSSELISYEGPFGVGYGVAAFEREDIGALVAEHDQAGVNETEGARLDLAGEDCAQPAVARDPLVVLAEETVRGYVTSGKLPDAPVLPADLPARAGCFVSIHVASTGDLRGCIGTIEPVQRALAEEIIANAVSAATRDPRFPAIVPDELDDLSISVDVLFEPEPTTLEALDPARYGVIVTQGPRRGLLLPDLDGIDTVEEQVRIACMKARIDFADVPDRVRLERFEVVRHE